MPRRPRHVSLFFPRSTPFYVGLLAQMRRGFEALGVETSGLCRHLGPEALPQWCSEYQPDAIFEMNRPRRDVPFLAPSVPHIVWVVDFNGRPLSYFEGSEITYLFSAGWPALFPHRGFHRWLGPGTDETLYSPPPDDAPRDLGATFVGHIPKPWTDEELDRDLTGGRGDCRFRDVLERLGRWLTTVPEAREPPGADALEFVDTFCRRATGFPVVVDERLAYDIRGRLIRHLDREALADAMLAHCDDVHFYGPENWRMWSSYAPYYRKHLDRPEEMRDVYRRSRLTFHQGNGVHFRSVDAMACGTILFYREHWHDRKPGGMADVFAPGEHYVPFTEATLAEALEHLRDDPDRVARIRGQAAAEIRRAHTWTHRARQILDDMEDVL